MFKPVYTKQFAKDVKRAQKRNKNLDKFRIIATTPLQGDTVDEIHRDHKLLGIYSDRRECHIESDWLLIYKPTKYTIIFERMGSHSDLFR